ncbi:PorP/SprF family type IX secretion system membrane protein [Ferruginibacter lapsinanis]|uniref:PorP/SprF family type IX secretion system membrane protein n=1 Tax=Ferruginibacter lapsinanis TaxID=563172 RepID=UPI001E5A3394|nr:PorP/SprF family type IX secretion system membrane protein [Ferruginibacter lapsinanis]UEG49803.1 PorP/SprF family type IX secretion system membrane protein [Ferruginibacter lapsinanis]
MKKTVPNLFLGLLLLMAASQVKAQDIHFSQFFEAPLLRNPALAGLFNGDLRLQMVYRNQWNSVTDAYQTGSLNGEYKIPVGTGEDFISVGGQILYDKSGTAQLTATHILPVFNYHKSLSEEKNKYLSIGFMAGLVQRSINRSKITTNSQFDGSSYNPNLSDGETFDKPTYSYFDGSVGMSYNSQMGENPDNNYFIGLAYHHFNRPSNISFYSTSTNKMLAKWVLSTGIKFNTNDYTYITLHADYSKQGPYTETIGGFMYSMKLDDPVEPRYLLHGGAMIRMNDAIIPVTKIEMKPFAVSVSYDANISSLKTASKGRGGFELGISYQKFFEKNNTSKNATRCPRF